MRVLPVNAKYACNIDNAYKAKMEPTYGWFSPCCKLGDLYSEDDEVYCGKSVNVVKLEL